MKKFLSAVLTVLLFIIVITAGIFLGNGFADCYDVRVNDYKLSENKMTINISRPKNMGYVRNIKVEAIESEVFVSFKQTFGTFNSKLGKKDSFDIELNEKTERIYFENGKNSYKIVLKKDFESGKWDYAKADDYYNAKMAKVINKRYIKNNKKNLQILMTKPFSENKTAVLAESWFEGKKETDLFVIDSKGKIVMQTGIEGPKSQCFSLEQVYFEGKTILFGTLDDSKWNPETDKTEKVDIETMLLKTENGSSSRQKVNINNGFIVIFDGESDIEEFNLYNKEGKILSNINDNPPQKYDFNNSDVEGEKNEE